MDPSTSSESPPQPQSISEAIPRAPPESHAGLNTNLNASREGSFSPFMNRAMFKNVETHHVDTRLKDRTTTVSHYASLGLNRKPTLGCENSTMTLESILDSLHTPSSSSGAQQQIRQRRWMSDDEDLAEMMVPETAESHHSNQMSLSEQYQQPLRNKTSRFTTGYLTEMGWQCIKNPHWDTKWAEDHPREHGVIDVPNNTNVSIISNKDEAYVDGTKNDDKDDAYASILDDKYFDHDGYLNYLTGRTSEEINNSSSRSSGLHRPPQTTTERVIVPTMVADRAIKGEVTKLNDEVEPPAGDQAGRWEVMEGDTHAPRIGRDAREKLSIRLRNTETQDLETFTFQGLLPQDVDWNKKAHIQEISKWRYQIFRRHDLPVHKVNVMYSRVEDAWLILYHKKLKATVEAGNIVKIPGPRPTMQAFNSFFEGKVLKDVNGVALPPRLARDETSIRGKIGNKKSVLWKLRDVTRKLLEGKHGGSLYVPVITDDELRRYQQDGTVTTDELNNDDLNATLQIGAITRRGSPKRERQEKDSCQDTKRLKPT
ncbi:Nn.00g042910.m01.CDS01 [Neocucurbitaria sp. VM-36]